MARKPSAEKALYSVHPGVAMVQKWIIDLPAKTGRSLDQWVAFIQAEGPHDEKSRRSWLKAEHGLGTNTARWLVERAEGAEKGIVEEDPETYLIAAERYVQAMYEGGKAHLRPIYDRLLRMGLALGDDVKACPCQTMVPLYRKHVFAQIKATTLRRIDLGLALKGVDDLPERLIDTGGLAKKDRITHRIAIGHIDEIDDEVGHWLRVAYRNDG